MKKTLIFASIMISLFSITALAAPAMVGQVEIADETVGFENTNDSADLMGTYGELTYSISGVKVTITGCNTSATSVVIPDTIEGCPVTSIGGSAFRACSSLTSVDLGNSVTSIGDCAFWTCVNLTNITIPGGVTSIGDYTFFCCESITSITIPDSVTSIGNGAFYNCTSLTSITIPDSVTSIGDYAFEYCTSLTSIDLGNSVTSIGGSAFEDCSSLTSVDLGNSVTSIGGGAFSGCSSFTSITIPDSVTSIGEDAFCNCTSLTSITVDENNEYYSSDERGFLFNKDKTVLIQYPIGYTATNHIIPDSVTSIGEDAFSFCESLTSIIIPDSVTSIGDYAFYGCSNLKIYGSAGSYAQTYANNNSIPFVKMKCGYNLTWKLTNDGTLTISGTGNMYDWSSYSSVPWYSYRDLIKNVVVENGVKSIGGYAFSFCESLTSITIPDSVTSIDDDAFRGCSSLTSIDLGNSVTGIGEYAFFYCTSLTSITIPDSVTSIGHGAFEYCTSLTSVDLGNSVTSIGGWAFGNCSSLTSITIPDSVTSIGGSAFYYCTSLTSVDLGNSVTRIGNESFRCCSSLTSITIPSGVTSIGNDAFTDCTNLTIYCEYQSYADLYALENGIRTIYTRYPVTYDANGGENPPEATKKTADIPLELSDKIPERSGYTFLGWSTKPDGEVEYNPSGVYNENSPLTLYAVWTPVLSGTCGEGLTWSIDQNGVLSIIGNGKMDDYNTTTPSPWYASSATVKAVVIQNGVTTVGDYAFYGFDRIESAEIPDSVTSIGGYAFDGCESLGFLSLHLDITFVGQNAFDEATSIEFEGSRNQWENLVSQSNVDAVCAFEGDYITLRGANKADAGEMGLEYKAYVYSQYASDFVTAKLYYSAELTLVDVVSAEFAFTTYTNPVFENGLFSVTVTSQYSYDGTQTLANTTYNPFNIVFGISETAPIGTYTAKFGAESEMISDIARPLCPGSVSVFVGDTLTIYGDDVIVNPSSYTVRGINSPSVPVIWKVDDEEVATVSDGGVVTPKMNGVVTLTAYYTENDAYFAQKTVEITDNNVTLVEIIGRDTVTDGEMYQAVIYPENLRHKTISWSVDNTEVATITESGVLTAHSAGSVNVRATVNDATGIYFEKTVNIPYVNAVIESMSSNLGQWDKPFVPYDREYVIEAPVGTNKLQFTAEFVSGSLLCNGALVMNGRAFEVTIAPGENVFVFERGNVGGKTDSSYKITVTCGVPGDINGDGSVTNRDASRLMQHLAGWDVDVIEAALDVTGDGIVNNRDASRILQYVAGWDVELH